MLSRNSKPWLVMFLVILSVGCRGGSEVSAQPDPPKPPRSDDGPDANGYRYTASGLGYRIVRPGDGVKPTARDNVTVHYRGRLHDGTEFDSSFKRRKPATFPLNGVIKGWTEGVQLIGEGGKIELRVPSELGYGQRGTPDGSIPPGATLFFEVELISVDR